MGGVEDDWGGYYYSRSVIDTWWIMWYAKMESLDAVETAAREVVAAVLVYRAMIRMRCDF